MEAGATRRERATREKLSVKVTRRKTRGYRRSGNLSGKKSGRTKRVKAATPQVRAVVNVEIAAERLNEIWTEPAVRARRSPMIGRLGKM